MMHSQTFRIALIAGGSLACGVIGQWVLLTTIGPGLETDAYFATLVLPQVVLAIVAGPLMNVLVPLLTTHDPHDRQALGWGIASALGVAGGGLFLLMAGTASLWVPLIALGFSEAAMTLAIHLARIQALMLCLSVLALTLTAHAHASGRFERAEGAMLIGSISALGIVAAFTPVFGVTAAAWSGVARAVTQAAILLPVLGWPSARGIELRQIFPSVWSRMRPLLLSGALTKCDPLVDRALLSLGPSGALSLFQVAQGLFASLVDIVNRSWIAPVLPVLAQGIKENPDDGHRRTRRMLWMLAWLFVFALLVLIAAGEEILQALFAHGHFSSEEVTQLWWILLGLVGVPLGSVAGQIASLAYYARGETTTLARLGVVSLFVFVPVKIIAFTQGGVLGLVVACSAYYLTNALCLVLIQWRKRLIGAW